MSKVLTIVCDLTAIPAAIRAQHVASTPRIFQAAQEICELPNGYALRLPNEAGMFLTLAHFVEHERLCCPFFSFGLEVEPNNGPLWLRLTGGEGAKQLLENLLGAQPDEATLKRLIDTGEDNRLDQIVGQTAIEFAGVLEKIAPVH